ncbi:MAG TPA: anthranilate phosphoribosyltransferase [Planctomycetota bacterium]|jgi:anthranilate phosphoribosyltransferase|nr:anthranilate phosphoribosyltransferase [Planctomycetota bacterium]
MNLGEAIERVTEGGELSREETRSVIGGTLVAEFDAAQLADFLTRLAARGETAAEITGGADALREAMIPFEHDHPDAIDTCGTGGDGAATFNLSTAAAIVAAAAGARVVKHGNRSQSSRCGSADLLEAAGIPLDLPLDASRVVLDAVGITFLFAPAHHPALQHAAPVRKALGVRTIFNFLGPLANPGRVRRQLVGVPEARRVAEIATALTDLGHERGYVVHGAGGADELTLAGENLVAAVGDAPVHSFDAQALGLSRAPVSRLRGGDAAANLRLLRLVLSGESNAMLDAVVMNAAAALVVAGVAADACDGVRQADEAITSGRAKATMSRWVEAARWARNA